MKSLIKCDMLNVYFRHFKFNTSNRIYILWKSISSMRKAYSVLFSLGKKSVYECLQNVNVIKTESFGWVLRWIAHTFDLTEEKRNCLTIKNWTDRNEMKPTISSLWLIGLIFRRIDSFESADFNAYEQNQK